MLDTNVLVSGFAYPASIPGRIVALGRSGGVSIVLSRYILDELARVLPRIKQLRLTPDEISGLVDSLIFLCEIVELADFKDRELRDKADRPVLGTLLAAEADYLISGDKDLLALAKRYAVVTPAEFWERHG